MKTFLKLITLPIGSFLLICFATFVVLFIVIPLGWFLRFWDDELPPPNMGVDDYPIDKIIEQDRKNGIS